MEIDVNHFIELLNLVKNKKLTELKAKQILNKFIPKSFSPKKEIKSSGRITNEKELTDIAEKVIKNKKDIIQNLLSFVFQISI